MISLTFFKSSNNESILSGSASFPVLVGIGEAKNRANDPLLRSNDDRRATGKFDGLALIFEAHCQAIFARDRARGIE